MCGIYSNASLPRFAKRAEIALHRWLASRSAIPASCTRSTLFSVRKEATSFDHTFRIADADLGSAGARV